MENGPIAAKRVKVSHLHRNTTSELILVNDSSVRRIIKVGCS